MSGIRLWLTLAAGLGFGVLSRIDRPALQVIVRNASSISGSLLMLTYLKKGETTARFFRRNVWEGMSNAELRTFAREQVSKE